MTDLVSFDDHREFIEEVEAFLRENLTSDLTRRQAATVSYFADPGVSTEWQQRLAIRGWGAPAWPKEYGGTGWSAAEQFIFESLCANAGAPPQYPVGLRMIGPTLIEFGSVFQREYYLPRIIFGEDYWCQGFSEPGAGSDLASLRTRAIKQGDYYLVSGSKIWTTHAHVANRMFALVRSSENERRQDGITLLLIDMNQPGVSVEPICTIDGEQELNQVYLDSVRVPIHDRVGEEGAGWSHAKYLLEFERGASIESPRLRKYLETVYELGRGCPYDELIGIAERELNTSIARIQIDLDAFEALELSAIEARCAGGSPGPARSALLKLRSTEIRQRISELSLRIVGSEILPDSVLGQEGQSNLETLGGCAPRNWSRRYLSDRSHTIFGGTSEIQRDILARILLGY